MIDVGQVLPRHSAPEVVANLRAAGVDPIMSRLLAARGVTNPDACRFDLERLLRPDTMAGIDAIGTALVGAIEAGEPICVIADYDCDGATACALAVRGLRRFGAVVDYTVPNRLVHGYGLSPDVVRMASRHPRLGQPRWLLTVDNGIASVDGVEAARQAGMRVLVTDHHLPGERLPRAHAIVDPNQPGCAFPSKHLAGVGVMFYVLLALRAAYRQRGDSTRGRIALADLLDLVALGTVADLVRLDENNRLLVEGGLRRLRSGRACAGLRALASVSGVQAHRAGARDLGFMLAPRINAAGRLADITTGIECLLADDDSHAAELARRLDDINRERRRLEATMRQEAIDDLEPEGTGRLGLVAFRPQWHEGVVGLVASKLKERRHRPAIAFAPASGEPGMLRGSARSIPGVHMRDVIDLADKRRPGLILRFGGHAMAAGLTLRDDALVPFSKAFEDALATLAEPGAFDRETLVDGPLEPEDIDFELVDALEAQVWGQGFPPPLFRNRFDILRQRVVGGQHLKLELRLGRRRLEAIAFNRSEPFPDAAELLYRPARNEYQGLASVQLMIEGIDECSPGEPGATI
ncbi:MAG: single-stranded-DNA-specific exonuclease RecJ [Burkholderiaceae bacterium]